MNKFRTYKVSWQEQVVISYGGLRLFFFGKFKKKQNKSFVLHLSRGAVGFSLAVVLDDSMWYKELFLTTALAMVFFTVFVQGSTIKFLVICPFLSIAYVLT